MIPDLAKSDKAGTSRAILQKDTLWTVQIMRGLAAMFVVIGHSQSAVAPIVHRAGGVFTRLTLIPWGAGVDLFFVISGFIIVHTSGRLFGREGAAGEFLIRRLARIVPLYWGVTTVFLTILIAATWKGGDPFPGGGPILASYAFLPMDTYGNGQYFPVFDLGWTLNYEMFFYILLAAVIALPRSRALAALGFLICTLVALGSWLTDPSILLFWTRPIIVDFGLGAGVGALIGTRVRVPAALRWTIAIAALCVLLLDPGQLFDGPVGSTVANQWPRVLLSGLPATLILSAAVLGGEPRMPSIAKPLVRVGDVSYSLYLLHPFALIAMEKIAQKLMIAHFAPGWFLVWATVAVSLPIAFASYSWIELPVTAAIRSRLSRPRSGLAVA